MGRDVLRSHGADLLVIVPPDAKDRLGRGEQAVLEVEYDTVSPYRAFVVRAAADAIVAGVNQQIIETAATEAADQAAAAGRPVAIPPEVAAAPTRAEVVNLAPSAPDLVAFYGIMVLALIVQHTVLTVSALSMLHDRRPGMLDLFRISPIGSGEILAGKYAAFTLLGTVVALAVLAILVFAFGVPFLGGPGIVLGVPRAPRRCLDRDRHRRGPGVRHGSPGHPDLAADPARVRLLQRARARPRPVLGARAGGSAGCSRSPRPAPCSRTCSCEDP